MIKQFARTITSFLVRDYIISEEEKEIYQYGTEQIIINLITLSVTCFIASVFKIWSITILWLLGFLPIRAVAGGYHAETPVRCNLLTFFVYTINIVVIQSWYHYMNLTMLMAIISLILLSIYKYAPVDHTNMVLEYEEYFKVKKRSRIIGTILSIGCLFIATLTRPDNKYLISTIMGVVTASISLVIGSLKRGGERDEEVKDIKAIS
ncbi:MAG: hypothetical protein CVV00_07470 [Firmicutes bacterium HGW-Firmicutes-5]|nr:MAG: hypothetical protein CVV00_07470 [Firmicutes bacterium HGW-Firmicutes-5]